MAHTRAELAALVAIEAQKAAWNHKRESDAKLLTSSEEDLFAALTERVRKLDQLAGQPVQVRPVRPGGPLDPGHPVTPDADDPGRPDLLTALAQEEAARVLATAEAEED